MTITLFVLGAVLGSFACAQVWRLRARQLVEDRDEYRRRKKHDPSLKSSEFYDSAELSGLESLIKPASKDRSQCLHCKKQLEFVDLIPIVSWLVLGGRCRRCRHKIGWTEFLAEIGLATAFALSYWAWPWPFEGLVGYVQFVLWLLLLIELTVLFIYDAKWSLLPFRLNIVFILTAVVFYAVTMWGGTGADLLSLLGALAALGGLYAVFASLGWAGFGDSILGVGLGFMVMEWQLGVLALFLANLFGLVYLIPLYAKKRVKHGMKVPFGPFMILASIVAVMGGNQIIDGFMNLSVDLMTQLML